MQQCLSVFDLMDMPICHPTVEVDLRTAMRSVRRQLDTQQRPLQASVCDRLPVEGLH
jgi:hypothetical protein